MLEEVKSRLAEIENEENGADKAALDAAISAAAAAKTGVVVETDAANVPAGAKWVTQAEMDALDNAIASADTVKNNASATQTEADNAESALNSAVTAFNNAKKDGTKTTGGEDPTTGSASVTVGFSGLPLDETITLTGPENKISWSAWTAVAFTAPETLTVSGWYADGIPVPGNSGNTLNLEARDYSLGSHTVLVKVSQNGKTYAKSVIFSVGE